MRGEYLRALEQEAGSASFDHFVAELIFAELVGNVVRHASGPVDVRLSCDNGDAVIEVYDRGKGFHYPPRVPEHPLAEYGRGLFLVAQFSKQLNVQTLPSQGSCVSAVFALSTGA